MCIRDSPETVQFNGVRCRANETLEESEKKEKFACLPAYHKMRKALDGVVKGRISSLSISQRDAAATALSLYKNEDTLRAKLTEAGFQAVSYTHLDVYKRQCTRCSGSPRRSPARPKP